MPIPKSEIGSNMQAGQRSAKAPTAPPRLVALFVPRGHVPYFLCQPKRPALRVRSAMSATVNQISIVVTGGRGKAGRVGSAPSSQVKNRPQRSPATIAQLQNALLRRKSNLMVDIMILLHRSCQGSLCCIPRKHMRHALHSFLLCIPPSMGIPMRPTRCRLAVQRSYSRPQDQR